jgi:hypothetical protein
MHNSIENIVKIIVDEVIKALAEKGMIALPEGKVAPCGGGTKTGIEQIDFSSYRTPVLTEKVINGLHELTGGIRVPCGTIVTPRAKEGLKKKNISIYYL